MKQELVQTINQKVYRRFPDFKGKQPKVQLQRTASGGSAKSQQARGKKTYLLTYSGQVKTIQDKTLYRSVRVVADERGKIIKMTTSR